MVALKDRTEEAVDANLDIPCVRNVLSELLISAARAYLGDAEESRRLEEAHALRALGVVREDEELIGQALERFEAMKLDWHAAETRKLVATES